MRNTLLPVLALTLAAPALAQDLGIPPTNAAAKPSGAPTLASVDRDGNGSVSRHEAARSKELVKQWDSLDQNRDGKLDQAEFARLETETLRAKEDDGPDSAPGQPQTPVTPEQ